MKIQLTDVEKSFDRPLFSGITLTIEGGDRVLISGPSGSGKTTLLGIILGLIKPDSGVISGVDYSSCAAVFQEDRLIEHLAGPENIYALLPEKFNRATAEAHLNELGIPESELNKPVFEWSGGMRRRLSVTRAMITGAKLIVMDEPFSGLDTQSAAITAEYILKYLNGSTLLISSHNTELSSTICNRVITI